jgi:NDP-sugar pyrophosphorylase family protein
MCRKIMKALIMAGGMGTRLRPLTYAIPKPLLPVGRKPILEFIIKQLRDSGFFEIYITVEYKSDLIKAYFRDGANLDVQITYIDESGPSGTAGTIKNMEGITNEPFIAMNGDLLTRLNFMNMYNAHIKSDAELTVGVKEYKYKFPYGLISIENGKITDISEKPELSFCINAGIYVFTPSALNVIPRGQFFDMPEAIKALLCQGRAVEHYEIKEYWRDIGQMEDYQEVVNGVEGGE